MLKCPFCQRNIIKYEPICPHCSKKLPEELRDLQDSKNEVDFSEVSTIYGIPAIDFLKRRPRKVLPPKKKRDSD